MPPKATAKAKPKVASTSTTSSPNVEGVIDSINLVDYRNRSAKPNNVSGNLGDHVQTVAAMRLILRWIKIWALVGNARVRGVLPLAGSKPTKEGLLAYPSITTIPRDEHRSGKGSSLSILYGWHMHKAADNRFAFPPTTKRVFVLSFHVATNQILTSAAIKYLADIGPVGCRDFSTLDKLRRLNVPSYYSGCLTLTLGSRLKGQTPIEHVRRSFLAVDTPQPNAKYALIRMCTGPNRNLSQRSQWLRALAVLRTLRRCKHVRTSRLHVFYPCLALRTQAMIVSPTGSTTKRDWGSPGRWATAWEYMKGTRNHVDDAQRLERQLAAAMGRALAGEDIAVAWRKATLIHVAYCFDGNFIVPTGASINSLLKHNGHLPLFIHLFHSGIPESALRDLQERLWMLHPGTMMQLHDLNPLNLQKDYKNHLKHVTAMTQARLWLPERLSDQVRRLIYLDGDVIVNDSILPLVDLRVPVIAARPSNQNLMNEKQWNNGFDWRGSESFNAGVMIMNLVALRKKNFGNWTRETLSKRPANDQTLLNLFCQGDFVKLEPKWNVYMSQHNDIKNYGANAKITHFCGSTKPWKGNCPLAALWRRYDIFNAPFTSDRVKTTQTSPRPSQRQTA